MAAQQGFVAFATKKEIEEKEMCVLFVPYMSASF